MTPIYPPSADLRVEPKPRLDPAALDSDAALEVHDNAVEAWGERGWAAVGRLCRWAADNGASGLDCPSQTRWSEVGLAATPPVPGS